MIKVVINASPIIGLCKIGLESIIFDLFDEIYLSEEVKEEIYIKNGKEKEFIINSSLNNNINLYNVKNKELIKSLYGKMHEGELSVITAAQELNCDFVIIDEIAARNFAESLSLTPLGLIGILRIAKRKGLIKEIKEYLIKLKNEGIWISDKLINKILIAENEI